MSELNPIPFIVALGVLVTIHELGHFLAAKWCGVRVLKFSIGFGNPIGFGRYRLRWERNGTEYVLAWIPLGGFVKMLGENPGEESSPASLADAERTLPAQPLWKKLAIVLAGPFVNLALPVVYFMALLWVGVAQPLPVVGSLEPDSPAAHVDIRPGDRILAVNGTEVEAWADVELAILEKPGQRIDLTLERAGNRLQRSLVAQPRKGLDPSLPGELGWSGLEHSRREARVLVLDGQSEAARAGLQTGDLVTRVGGTEVGDWSDLAAAFAAAPAGPLRVAVDRAGSPVELTLTGGSGTAALGMAPVAFVIESVEAGAPAAEAGILPGDVIVAVDGARVHTFRSFYEAVRASGGRVLALRLARGGEQRTVNVKPAPIAGKKDAAGEPVYRVGIGSRDALVPGAVETRRVRNPIESLPLGVGMTYKFTKLILGSLRNVFVSIDSIGGPIAIASQSKQAWERGVESFVHMIVFLSINLGVLNLLPIPVLDGGQAVMFTLEAALRERFTLRAREFAQTIGFALLLALMGVAFYNDITNYVVGFVKSL